MKPFKEKETLKDVIDELEQLLEIYSIRKECCDDKILVIQSILLNLKEINRKEGKK